MKSTRYGLCSGARSDLQVADAAPCGIHLVSTAIPTTSRFVSSCARREAPVRDHMPPCPTTRRPKSSVPCPGHGPTAEATSAGESLSARRRRRRAGNRRPGPRPPAARRPDPPPPAARRPEPRHPAARRLLASLVSEGLAPSRCDSPNSPRARLRPRDPADRSRRLGLSFSRLSYRPARSWPRSGSRSARVRSAARSGAFRSRSSRGDSPGHRRLDRPLARLLDRPPATRPAAGDPDIHPRRSAERPSVRGRSTGDPLAVLYRRGESAPFWRP